MYYDKECDDYIYEVGDRVRISDADDVSNKHLHKGSTGTVACISVDKNIVGVSWDSNVAGHALDGACEYGYGWWTAPSNLALDSEESNFDMTDNDEMESFIESLK